MDHIESNGQQQKNSENRALHRPGIPSFRFVSDRGGRVHMARIAALWTSMPYKFTGSSLPGTMNSLGRLDSALSTSQQPHYERRSVRLAITRETLSFYTERCDNKAYIFLSTQQKSIVKSPSQIPRRYSPLTQSLCPQALFRTATMLLAEPSVSPSKCPGPNHTVHFFVGSSHWTAVHAGRSRRVSSKPLSSRLKSPR